MSKSYQGLLPAFGILFAGLSQKSAAQFGESPDSAFQGSAFMGWESRYFFRGRWFGDQSVWMELSVTQELSRQWQGNFHFFYTDIADRSQTFSEAQLGGSFSYDTGHGSLDLGFSHYHFFDGFGGNGTTRPILGNRDSTELNLTYSRDFWKEVSFHVTTAYDFRIDACYAEVGLLKRWQLHDRLGLGLSVSTGYSIDDYYSQGLGNGDDRHGFTHSIATLTFPFQLREGTFLTPHASANFSHGARDASNALSNRNGTEFFWGATLTFDF